MVLPQVLERLVLQVRTSGCICTRHHDPHRNASSVTRLIEEIPHNNMVCFCLVQCGITGEGFRELSCTVETTTYAILPRTFLLPVTHYECKIVCYNSEESQPVFSFPLWLCWLHILSPCSALSSHRRGLKITTVSAVTTKPVFFSTFLLCSPARLKGQHRKPLRLSRQLERD